jgi:hypothetical protein
MCSKIVKDKKYLRRENLRMQNIFPILLQRFRRKGFMAIELSELMKDIMNTIRQNENHTIEAVNSELESLGWGIQIMDQALFEEAISLFESSDISEFEKYIQRIEGN